MASLMTSFASDVSSDLEATVAALIECFAKLTEA